MASPTGWILHVDLDQFVAAVEIRRRPELRGRPVVVGGSGDPTQRRQVVATASYEARAFGVGSGMPLRAAFRRCPDAVFLPMDHAAYEAASAEVMDALRAYPSEPPPVVEVWGWDEAFLGVRTDDPEALAAGLQAAVLAATELSCAIGIGDNKHRAKLATGFAKPGGIGRLTAETWRDVMGHRSTRALWGIGSKTADKLVGLGIETVDQLGAADPDELAARFGPTTGPYLVGLGRGEGGTGVSAAPWVARSRSHESTFPEDLVDRGEVEAQVRRLAAEVVADVVAERRSAARVAVKVRYASFFTRSSITTLDEPTTDIDVVQAAALRVLERFDLDRPIRLLGVRAELTAAVPTEPRAAP